MAASKNLLPLLIVCIISFLILSYKLSEVPNGVYLDEATTGYNAFSILETGKDEYGKEYPLAFRFFGSYSPPLYTYLTVIPVSIFGLNEFSVRIVSVISGVLMVLVLYGFLKELTGVSKGVSYLLLFLFIITPWNFFFTRTGYEIYLGFFLFSLGALFCLKGIISKFFLIPGFAILSLSTYAAHSQIYSVPLFIAGFLILFHKPIVKDLPVLGLIIALIIQIPHLALLGTEAFLNKSDLFYSAEKFTNSQKILFLPDLISIPLSFGFSFFARVVTYFSPYSLFFLADPDPQRSLPEVSVFYNWMIVPFLFGAYVVLKNIKETLAKSLALLIIAAVIPAALTKDPFSTQRGLSLLLPLFLIISLGVSSLYKKIGTKKFYSLALLLLIISAILLWRSYFVLLPSERAVAWNYGYKELAVIVSENPGTQYLIENTKDKPSYIELAFFLRTNPSHIQDSVDRDIKEDYYNLSKFDPDYKFDNVRTGKIKWEEDIYKSQILVGDEFMVSPTQAKEHFLTEVFVINDPRGYPILKGFQTNPDKKCLEAAFLSELCKPR